MRWQRRQGRLTSPAPVQDSAAPQTILDPAQRLSCRRRWHQRSCPDDSAQMPDRTTPADFQLACGQERAAFLPPAQYCCFCKRDSASFRSSAARSSAAWLRTRLVLRTRLRDGMHGAARQHRSRDGLIDAHWIQSSRSLRCAPATFRYAILWILPRFQVIRPQQSARLGLRLQGRGR